MSGKPGLSGGMMGAMAAGAAVVAGVVGWQFRGGGAPDPVPPLPVAQSVPPPAVQPAPVVPSAVAPTAPQPTPPAETAASAAAPAPEATVAEPAAAPRPPAFDTFRHGRDGTAVVAGTAPPGAGVGILIDGAEVARASADAGGRFAAIFTLDPAPLARVMVLRARLADGSDLDSAASLMIAPAPAEAVATEAVATEAVATAPAPPAVPADPAPAEVAAAAAPEPAADPAPLAVPPAEPAQLASVAAPAPQPEAAAPAVAPPPPAVTAPPGPAASPAPAPAEAPPTTVAQTPRPDPAPAPAQPSNLLVSDSGVAVLRPTPEQPMVIDSISYTGAGAVQVAGKGRAGALVRLYLDNVVQFDTLADERGTWGGTLPPVVPGLYTLRADQVDPAGKVLARSETPFLREPPEALAAAVATTGATPAAEVVTVQPGYTLWGIARRSYGEGVLYVKVFEANRAQIRNPDLIYPGQVFALPPAD